MNPAAVTGFLAYDFPVAFAGKARALSKKEFQRTDGWGDFPVEGSLSSPLPWYWLVNRPRGCHRIEAETPAMFNRTRVLNAPIELMIGSTYISSLTYRKSPRHYKVARDA
ncbi:MAG: hypothetical protein ACPHJ3_02020 [Rubripirellula sp.]